MRSSDFDLFIIGGGVNGCGIARDAAGRGLSVCLAERNDLASATSSASTKLFHGGLRYLEYFEFRLVRDALIERETLLRAMPHIAWPMRFVLPYHPDMRFDSETPTSRLLTRILPGMKGRRPAWLIRLGLFLYDSLGRRQILPGTKRLDLADSPEGQPLQDRFRLAFEYSDCWVEDSRLVVLNARDAAERGARIMVRTEVTSARRMKDHWLIEMVDKDSGQTHSATADMLVNAAGPWAAETVTATIGQGASARLRHVRGSHIVVERLYDHDKCYFLQGSDGRIVFAIPYETDFTLIGTTDVDHADMGERPHCTDEERDYLLAFVNRYFDRQLGAGDVVWTYSGVRPLYDDGAQTAAAATRDYVIEADTDGALLINIFGGKITTYRKLAEHALDKIAAHRPDIAPGWTAGVALPGGDFPVDGFDSQVEALRQRYPFLDIGWARRLARAYGTDAFTLLGDARNAGDLGRDFGARLTQREVDWLVEKEWAREADDILWRRSKLGLRFDAAMVARLSDYMDRQTRRSAAE
ncbi:glycerol-3-phosphate dehydrogenase [Notoacmeibacter marinus]|uniref:Glycerol-3-phosphate dehydrogenase n=1 Tax=Notoacmeibacter marinus TaxID=1876515 RepID=A0A231V3K1_9HYPH|nr:glycerol-3-phosphate dehydrogenase [Notoacmeibacter marinus]OXT02759.1 glycerol-3-phosphate dehydrogenase [Notoacmeibacter marinus]